MIAVLGGRPAARGYRTLSQHSNTDLVDDANLLETAGMKHCWLPTIGQGVSLSAGSAVTHRDCDGGAGAIVMRATTDRLELKFILAATKE